jgi:flavin-dependent dehydrogenase
MGLTSRQQYDVAILGGGLAGLTLARQLALARPEIRILVAEKRTHPVPEAAFKVGESAAEVASHYLGRVLGLKEHLKTHQLRKAGLRFFCTAGDNRDIARRVEFGPHRFPPVPGYQLDRGRLENYLAETSADLGIELLDGTSVREVTLADERHTIRLRQGEAEGSVSAHWVVDATGRTGLLKRQLGLGRPVEHDCNAAWFRVDAIIDVDDWSDDPDWHARVPRGLRRFSTNHLVGRGYWVWLIPLAGGATSVGIVADPRYHPFNELTRFEPALAWLHAHEPQCAQAVEDARDRLMDFKVMRHFAYGCERVFSADRWALTGEAGVFTDPLYSPGSDFIAIGNTFISDLILRELEGEDIRERTAKHQQLYLRLFAHNLTVYDRQYGLLGNAQACMAKVVWDQSMWFAVPALLFFRQKLAHLPFMQSVGCELEPYYRINAFAQALFREWSRLDPREWREAWITQRSFDFLWYLHIGQAMPYTDDELRPQIGKNVRVLEAVARLMLEGARRRVADHSLLDELSAEWDFPGVAQNGKGLEDFGLETINHAWLDPVRAPSEAGYRLA